MTSLDIKCNDDSQSRGINTVGRKSVWEIVTDRLSNKKLLNHCLKLSHTHTHKWLKNAEETDAECSKRLLKKGWSLIHVAACCMAAYITASISAKLQCNLLTLFLSLPITQTTPYGYLRWDLELERGKRGGRVFMEQATFLFSFPLSSMRPSD